MLSLISFFDKFRRYMMVGAFNTGLCLAVMSVGAYCGLGYLLYTAVGYLTTICLSFFMNLRYTFKTRDRTGYRLLGFMLVSLSNLTIVECIEYYLIDYFALPRELAILLGMTWYVIAGFLLNNFVVYRAVATENKSTSIQ